MADDKGQDADTTTTAPPPSSTSNTNKSGTTLLADIRSLLNNEELTDIVLVPTIAEPNCDGDNIKDDASEVSYIGTIGREVPTIKSILAARSPVFRRMLYGDFRETRARNDDDGVLRVKLEYSSSVLRLLVEFCFTDKLDSLEGESEDAEDGDSSDSRCTDDEKDAFSAPSLSNTARLLTSLSAAAHYFDIPKLEYDISSRLDEIMSKHPSLSCVVLDEAHKIMQEDLCSVALERIRARPKAALLPRNRDHIDGFDQQESGNEGGVVALSASLLERVVFDDVSTASEWTKFMCLQRWVEGCPHQVTKQMEELTLKDTPSDEEDERKCETNNSQPTHREQKHAIAAHLAQKLDLSLIPASDLDAVYKSNLLSTSDLFKAYRLQALNAERTKSKVFVEGAGLSEINGTYIQCGSHEGTPMYNKEGVWRDREEVFRIFLCTYSNGNKSWCISIVPKGKEPGKTTDVDFYECPVAYGGKGGVGPYSMSENGLGVVPGRGWKLVNFGMPPAPKCSLIPGCLDA